MKKKFKILTIIGARPNFIKISPFLKEQKKYKEIESVLVHTGQHYDFNMSDIFLNEFKIQKPDYNLEVGSASHAIQTAQVMEKLEKVIIKEQPDLVVIIGDINSSLAGCLVAKKLKIQVAHIEAGPRLNSKTNPEEINRIVADHISDFLFCPNALSVKNLKNEGITTGVYNVGDIMYETFLESSGVAFKKSDILRKIGLTPKKYFLATIHRAENTDSKKRLEKIISALSSLENVVFCCHPRTANYLKKYDLWKIVSNTIKVIEPLGYLDMICLEKNAAKIITDSGGMQKEAYWSRVACITLFESTPWPETVDAGWNFLAGADKNKIIRAAESFIPTGRCKNYFGDGKTAEKIIKILLRQWKIKNKTS